MMRSVVLLALSACTQSLVISPRHRPLPFPQSEQRKQSSTTVATRRALPRRHTGRDRRAPPVSVRITMRAGRSDDLAVTIEGANGETRRVRRTSRRSDLRSQQAVAAAVVSTGIEEVVEETMEGEEGRASSSGSWEEAQGGTETISDETSWEERDLVDKVVSGDIYDKHTKLYEPMEGMQIKKTYGFWTWQVFGFIFVQNFVRLLVRKGGDLKKLTMEEINWDHVVTEPEHLKELKAYCCEECGYTLYPARGRHEKFFDSVEDFECPECGAPRSAFYDANDPDDPHNQVVEKGDGKEETSGAEKGDVITMPAAASTSTSARVAKAGDSEVQDEESSVTFSEATSHDGDEEEPFLEPFGETSAERSAAVSFPSSSTTDRDDDDEDADDLLDFE